MNHEIIKRWFEITRDAVDSAAAGWNPAGGWSRANCEPMQDVKFRILLYQYLSGSLGEAVAEAVAESRESEPAAAEDIRREVYNLLMEHAIEGIFREEDGIEASMFLFRCAKKDVRDPKQFFRMLRSALEADVTEQEAADIAGRAAEELRQRLAAEEWQG